MIDLTNKKKTGILYIRNNYTKIYKGGKYEYNTTSEF